MRKLILSLALATFFSPISKAELVVIVNKENSLTEVSQSQLIDLYMGRHSEFPNGELAIPLDQDHSSQQREQFYRTLVNRTVAQVDAYWARLSFTGRSSPPKKLGDNQSIVDVIKKNVSAVGYVDSSELVDNSVKVVWREP